MEKYYLGFDAGTQSVKAAVYDEDMKCVASCVNPTELYYPHPGWVEMDADQYLEAAAAGIRGCTEQMKKMGKDPAGIRAVFGDGIICGIVGVDENFQAVTPYINYLDSRTQKDVEELCAKNLDIWAEETGNPQPNCMFPAMFARWMMRNCEEYKKRGKKFVHNAPYILAHLAGLKAEDAFIDWGTMSGWGLGYCVLEKRWSKEQLEILGIPEEMMPAIKKPWDIIGNLTEEFAEKTGLAAGTPICAGAGDTMQSMIGCGVTETNKAADVAGTCAMFCIATDGIKPELCRPENQLIFNSGTLENTYFYWGYIRTGGLALRWFRDNVCGETGNGAYFDELTKKAEQVPAGSNGVLFLPYLTGGMDDMQDVSACFLNMTMDTDQGILWNAVLEAIGYDYMGVTDAYKGGGIIPDVITVTEGGSRSGRWNQIKADMMNCPVVTLETAEGAVLTDAAAAAYAVGDIGDLKTAFENNLKVKETYKPRPENTVKYRKIYDMQKTLIRKDMSQAFRVMKEITAL